MVSLIWENLRKSFGPHFTEQGGARVLTRPCWR